MTRVEFTKNICSLILEMIAQGERPLLDYVKRSDEEQLRLYDLGLSQCDGTHNVSQHQRGRAADIYFLSDDGMGIEDPLFGHEYWHEVWETHYGGKPMISWDQGHFE